MYPTIKCAAEWSKTLINFFDITESILEGVLETDLHAKPTDSNQ